MSTKNGYNNAAFTEKLEKCDRGRDSLNNRLEVAGYQAINETFLDDNGQEYCYEEPDSYIDFIGQQGIRCGPGCRRSVAVVIDQGHHNQYRRMAPAETYSRSLCVGYHRMDPSRTMSRHRYESINSDERYSENRDLTRLNGFSTRHEYETIDALHRRYEEIEASNEEYVDYPEDRMGAIKKETYLPTRESPLGSSGTIKHIEPNCRLNLTPVSTPKKVQLSTPQKSTSSNSPKDTPKRKLTRRNTIVLAPMLANIDKQQQLQQLHQNVVGLHRSRSAIITTPRRPKLIRGSEGLTPVTALVHPITTTPEKTIYGQCNSALIGKSMPSLTPIKYHTPLKLQSFNHIMESDVMEPILDRATSINRRPNTAVISPNMRNSVAAPLLPASSLRQRERSPPPVKSPSTFSKASWASLPTIHLPTEMLCCVGFLLLAAGAATSILCFYLLAVGGRKYFLNFGAVAGFSSLVLGMFSCRTNKWKWLPHRNYMTGYVLLTMFSILNSACLGGIVYALEGKSYALLDTLGGAVCGVSVVVIIGSVLGMVTSGCCHRPPPDNRVAHGVTGFTV